MTIQEVAAKYSEYQIEMRRYFHENPELSYKEFNTSSKVKEELDKMNIPWRVCGSETGILATITGKKPGKTILLRGDMDALEVKEETGLPYASKTEGVMHACGHDCHISMLLTAAHILNDMKDELSGTVKLAFQPAEELACGAVGMIQDGALEGVDGCFAIHVWSDIESGKVVCNAGPAMASVGRFKIEMQGMGGHGATPHLCVDAAVAASATILNLQTIVSRELSPQDSACVTVGYVRSGDRFNCVADSAYMEGTTRAFSRDVSGSFEERITRIARDTAKAFRTKAVVTYDHLTDPVVNDADMAELVQTAARDVVASDAPIQHPPLSPGEDFAYFMNEVPGAVALLGVRNVDCNAIWPQHSNKYCVDEKILLHGAMLYAKVALSFNKK